MSALRMKNLIPAVYSSAVKTSMGSSRLATSFCKNQASIATYQMTSSRYIHQTTLVSESVKDMDASEKVKKLTEEILTLNVIEVNQLLFTLQNKLGIPDSALVGGGSVPSGGGAAPAAAEAAAPEPVKEKDAFNIKLGAVDAKAKIKIIKEVRAITGLGLKEAKELVEKAPVVIKEGVKKEEAEAFKKLLVDAGAAVDLE